VRNEFSLQYENMYEEKPCVDTCKTLIKESKVDGFLLEEKGEEN